MIGVYGIFRKSDDKCMYVGQSTNIDKRIKHHLNGHTKNSFNKEEYYGKILETHDIDDKQYRLNREAYLIEQLNPELNEFRDRHRHHSEESKKKMKENHADFSGENHPSFGTHFKWMNNGVINKHVKPDELDKYIQDGWKLGMIK